ncbi:hypothetical protein WDW86_00230 [Bdellovibrionota bacterium FG-2]
MAFEIIGQGKFLVFRANREIFDELELYSLMNAFKRHAQEDREFILDFTRTKQVLDGIAELLMSSAKSSRASLSVRVVGNKDVLNAFRKCDSGKVFKYFDETATAIRGT